MGNVSSSQVNYLTEVANKSMSDSVNTLQTKVSNQSVQSLSTVTKIKTISGNCKIVNQPQMGQNVAVTSAVANTMTKDVAEKMFTDLQKAIQNTTEQTNRGIPSFNVNASKTLTNSKTRVVNIMQQSLKNTVKASTNSEATQNMKNAFYADLCTGNGQVYNNPQAFQSTFVKQFVKNVVDEMQKSNLITVSNDTATTGTTQLNQHSLWDALSGGTGMGSIAMVIVLIVVIYFGYKLLS